jgi:hypothetical protein
MCTGRRATTMTGYEANACRAGVGRVALGWCRGGSRSGCRPRSSWSGAAVVAGLSPRPPGRPLSLVPGRSPGANRQPAGGSGSLGCECVSHVLVCRRWGQRRPDHLGGRCAATAAPTVNGALLRPRDAHKLPYRHTPISRSSRFTGLPHRSVFGGPTGRPVQRQAHRGHNLVGQRLPLGGPQREQVADVEDDRVNKMSDLAQHR